MGFHAAADSENATDSGELDAGPVTRKTWVLAGVAVLAVVIATGGVVVISGGKPATSAAQEPPPTTVQVEKRELSAMASVTATLTYQAGPGGTPYSVINQASGTYTELPVPGQVISQGQVLYRVNDSPVGLLYGSIPAYRTPVSRGERRGRGRAQRRSRRPRLRHVGSAESQLLPSSDRPRPQAWRNFRPSWE